MSTVDRSSRKQCVHLANAALMLIYIVRFIVRYVVDGLNSSPKLWHFAQIWILPIVRAWPFVRNVLIRPCHRESISIWATAPKLMKHPKCEFAPNLKWCKSLINGPLKTQPIFRICLRLKRRGYRFLFWFEMHTRTAVVWRLKLLLLSCDRVCRGHITLVSFSWTAPAELIRESAKSISVRNWRERACLTCLPEYVKWSRFFHHLNLKYVCAMDDGWNEERTTWWS